jgi:hypothetical protein
MLSRIVLTLAQLQYAKKLHRQHRGHSEEEFDKALVSAEIKEEFNDDGTITVELRLPEPPRWKIFREKYWSFLVRAAKVTPFSEAQMQIPFEKTKIHTPVQTEPVKERVAAASEPVAETPKPPEPPEPTLTIPFQIGFSPEGQNALSSLLGVLERLEPKFNFQQLFPWLEMIHQEQLELLKSILLLLKTVVDKSGNTSDPSTHSVAPIATPVEGVIQKELDESTKWTTVQFVDAMHKKHRRVGRGSFSWMYRSLNVESLKCIQMRAGVSLKTIQDEKGWSPENRSKVEPHIWLWFYLGTPTLCASSEDYIKGVKQPIRYDWDPISLRHCLEDVLKVPKDDITEAAKWARHYIPKAPIYPSRRAQVVYIPHPFDARFPKYSAPPQNPILPSMPNPPPVPPTQSGIPPVHI